MNKDAVESLIRTIGSSFSLSMQNQLRLIAFEKTLEEKDHELYAAYRQKLELLRTDKTFEIDAQALKGLRAKLLREV